MIAGTVSATGTRLEGVDEHLDLGASTVANARCGQCVERRSCSLARRWEAPARAWRIGQVLLMTALHVPSLSRPWRTSDNKARCGLSESDLRSVAGRCMGCAGETASCPICCVRPDDMLYHTRYRGASERQASRCGDSGDGSCVEVKRFLELRLGFTAGVCSLVQVRWSFEPVITSEKPEGEPGSSPLLQFELELSIADVPLKTYSTTHMLQSTFGLPPSRQTRITPIVGDIGQLALRQRILRVGRALAVAAELGLLRRAVHEPIVLVGHVLETLSEE